MQTLLYDRERDRRKDRDLRRSRTNQMERAVVAVAVAVDALSLKDRVIVFNNALRRALDDLAESQP